MQESQSAPSKKSPGCRNEGDIDDDKQQESARNEDARHVGNKNNDDDPDNDHDVDTDNDDDSSVWIGIDLGTTHSCAAVWDARRGRPKWMRLGPLALSPGRKASGKVGRMVPSVLLFATTDFVHQLSHQTNTTTAVASYADFFVPWRQDKAYMVCVGARALEWLDQAYQTSMSSTTADPTISMAAIASPEQVSAALVSSVKRLVGQQHDNREEEDEHRPEMATTIGSNNQIQIQVTPLGASQPIRIDVMDIVTILLESIRLAANTYLQQTMRHKKFVLPMKKHPTTNTALLDCRHVVLGVPAHWSQAERLPWTRAAHQAGFVTCSTLIESTAAAMAYGLFLRRRTTSTEQSQSNQPQQRLSVASQPGTKRILVLDMGGGTTDVTIVEMADNNNLTQSQDDDDDNASTAVVVTYGESIGGDNLDRALYQMVMKRFEEDSSSFGSGNHGDGIVTPHEQRWLLRQCHRAKEQLCGDVDHGETQPLEHVTIVLPRGQKSVTITQTDFHTAIQSCLKQVQSVIQHCLQRYQQKIVQKDPVLMNEVVLIGGSTRVPAVRELVRQLFPPPHPPELCLSVNAMSAVAQGTAIQAAIESNLVPMHEIRSALMLDSLPYAIGVLTSPDHFVPVLPQDARLPAKGIVKFALADVNQKGVTVVAAEQIGPDQYETIQEFTFLLHRLTHRQILEMQSHNETRSVDIGMAMQTTGQLVVSLFDGKDPEHLRKKKRQERGVIVADQPLAYLQEEIFGVGSDQFGLIVAAVVLLVLYVAGKIAFAESRRKILEDDRIGDIALRHDDTEF